MQDVLKRDARFIKTKAAVVLNTSSGSCDESSLHAVVERIRSAGIETIRTWCGDGDMLSNALQEVRRYKPRLLVVLGGDGTIRSAAQICGATNPLLLTLPGGTLNVLSTKLHGRNTWSQILDAALSSPHAVPVSGGQAGGKQFFVGAIVGSHTAFVHAREALRRGDVSGLLEHGAAALTTPLNDGIEYQLDDGAWRAGGALLITCPLASEIVDTNEPALEVTVVTIDDAYKALNLLLSTTLGTWRDDPAVTCVKTKCVKVRSTQPLEAALDGEPMSFGRHLEVHHTKRAFTALCAKKTER